MPHPRAHPHESGLEHGISRDLVKQRRAVGAGFGVSARLTTHHFNGNLDEVKHSLGQFVSGKTHRSQTSSEKFE